MESWGLVVQGAQEFGDFDSADGKKKVKTVSSRKRAREEEEEEEGG